MKSIIRQNNDKKPINPIALFIAFLLGAVTVFAVFWRIRASKNKKGAGVSDGALDRDCAQEDRELEELLKKLRKENECRMWPEHEVCRPIYVQTEQVKPYRPRKRVSAKKIFARATAAVAAAALVVTGITMAPLDRVPASTVLAKESFGGIKQIVEEHDKDHPFVILDIFPGKAEVDGYEFSLGTIGYLAPGQSPLQQDFVRIFKGDDKEKFYDYTERKTLTEKVIGSGSGLVYQEAYGGTEKDLDTGGWSRIFDPVGGNPDESENLANVPTGRLYARVERRPDDSTGPLAGFDYNSEEFSISAANLSAADGIYTFAGGDTGKYHVIFEGPVMATSGYSPEEIESGSYEEVVLGGSYSDATGVYIVENGEYHYARTIGELKGSVEEKPEETEQPEEPDEEDGDETDGEDTDGEDTDGEDGEDTGGEDGEDTDGEDGDETDGETEDKTGGETEDKTGVGTGDETDDEVVEEARKETGSGTGGRWYLCVNEEPEENEPEVTPVSETEKVTYCVLKFSYVETEEEQLLYQISGEPRLISTEGDDPRPYDSYVKEKGNDLPSSSLYAVEEAADTFSDEPAVVGHFTYVGGGQGEYKLTRVPGAGTAAAVSDTGDTDAEEDMDSEEEVDSEDADAQNNSARAAGSGSVYVEVQNAPVYIKCTDTDKEEWLERYVFNSLKSQDNASDEFAIRVYPVFAGDEEVSAMIAGADLIYLEDGAGLYFASDESVTKSYIQPNATGDAAGGPADISDAAIGSLLYAAVEESKPVIVDYGIITSEDYPKSRYQKLAKAFLKKDLAAFYQEMAKSGNLVNNILMNVDKDLKDFPDKTDNEYHYVNQNVYIVKNALAAEDFPEVMDKGTASAGFTEVLAAIRAENALLSEGAEKLTENISKAMAVQYIINYSLGLVGEYKDLSILELQPTANTKSDLHRDPNPDKGSVVLFWQREDRDERPQILRSSRMIETNVTLSSVAAFNTSHQDINADYNMIFIGLDGQRFYHEEDDNGVLQTRYNDSSLDDTVYHRGDRVSGGDARYDANDITRQKKEELLDYLRAGYPIVVENECFKGKSAKKAKVEDINTKYIAEDTQMYAFFKEAISMHRENQTGDGDGSESGIGLYTIEDVHSSAMFVMQLTALRPKIEILGKNDGTDDGDSDGWNVVPSDEDKELEVVSYDISDTEEISDRPGFTRGTIRYRIPKDKNYEWKLATHLYLDLNYDGIFAPEEEFTEYQHEQTADGGQISVDFKEISFGYVPWKLEVTVLNDDNSENRYRRASAQGCFTIRGKDATKIRVLQILDDTENSNANLQEQYDKYHTGGDGKDFMLAHFIDSAAESLGIEWDIRTISPVGKNGLEDMLSRNSNYLSQWDVVVLGFGESGNPGDVVMPAVEDYIATGGSVLVSSAGASSDRLGLPVYDLGQSDQQTYGKLAQGSGEKYRYKDINTDLFYKTSGLDVDRINEGLITKRPYEIKNTISLGGLTEVAVPDYLLDIGEENQTGQAYTTAWFTLYDSDKDRKGGYSASPRDGRNNYYVYSKGNVVYVGQSEYPYTYESKDGGVPEGAGIDECKIFVNALMAAYNGGIHRVNVSIVAGFNGVNKVESVTVPYDVAFREGGDTKGGILGETVDVYFRFTDNNIAFDKTTELSFYYKSAKNADEDADTSLLLPGGVINEADYAVFTSPVWAVENNRLVEVTEGIVPDKVYRIKAPLEALQSGVDQKSEICVVITNTYTRPGRIVKMLSVDSVSLNRAQMFLLE